MLIGNIITSTKINDTNFKISEELDSIDDLLPTIIIGWKKTKEKYGDDVSILHKKIKDNLYWTFSPTERKVDYEKDIILFKELCYNNVGKNIHYVYLDILHGKLHTIKKIIKKIYSLKTPISYISKTNMLYIFDENIIFGVDLNITELIGINKDKIIDRVTRFSNSILIGNEIFNKCKEYIKKLDNREKLLPYIYKNGEYGKDSDISIICNK